MIDAMFNGSNVPVLAEVLNFTEARHGVLAGNIANQDTPGYRTRDLSVDTFQQRLKDAILSQQESHGTLSPGVASSTAGDPMRAVRDTADEIVFHDMSDVSIERQVTEMNKNQFMHSLAVQLINSQFRLLQTAVSERV